MVHFVVDMILGTIFVTRPHIIEWAYEVSIVFYESHTYHKSRNILFLDK